PPTRGPSNMRRDRLLALLAQEGKPAALEAAPMELLGIRTGGNPVPVKQLTAIEGRTKADFNRLDRQSNEYVFFFDEDKDNPQSPSTAFRTDENFRLITAIEYSNGRWVNILAPRSATLFARQIEIWNHTVDAASSGTALGASLFSWMSGSGSTASEPPPPRI